MATFHFELVSPEKIAFSGEVDQVDLPGADGEFGVLAGHAPLVATLRPGLMTVTSQGRTEKLVILGGVAEISDKGLSVLAEVATSVAELDHAVLETQIKQLETEISALQPGSEVDRLIERLDHYKVIQQQVVSTAMH
jgi:F-type H+-transporting ATPase subunit epsilon